MRDKRSLIVIIVLLVINLPLGIWGMVLHSQDEKAKLDTNPNKDYVYNNKVYFYKDDTLVSTYDCAICSAPVSTNKDDDYKINYYKQGTYEVPKVLANGYALFKEGEKTVLYNYENKAAVLQFDAINTYNVEHSTPVVIVSSDGMYGVMSLDTMLPLIPYKYDYIAIPNRVKDNILDTSRFIAKDGDKWLILESDGSSKIDPFDEPIVDFNSKYIVIIDNGIYRIYDVAHHELVPELAKIAVYAIDEYIIIIDNNNVLSLYDDLEENPLKTYNLPDYQEIYFNYKEGQINIYTDTELFESVAIK